MKKQAKEDAYLHILKYTGLFGGVQGLSILVGIVRNKLVAMILGPDGMGLISLFNSSIKLVSDSTNFGISMSAVKTLSEAFETGNDARIESDIRLIRCWSVLTALLGMVVCVALSPLLNQWTFSWGDHTLHFVLLAPVVALTAITGGETSILKAARKLNRLAAISVYNLIFALVVTIPLYYYFGEAAIVPSLVLVALGQCLTTMVYSCYLYPPKLSAFRRSVREGKGLIGLGLAFVLAGILGSGAEFVIRSYMNYTGNLASVGLYNAGFMITMTYAGMVFSAMETDYFPRLSGISDLGTAFSHTVNSQIEISLLIVSPLVVIFIVCLPCLLPLLFSVKFLPVIGMMRFALVAMMLRAINLPLEYITLSRGDSKTYLFLEGVYDVVFVLAVIIGFEYGGVTGTGLALLLTNSFNFVMVLVIVSVRYKVVLSQSVRRYILIQLPLGLVTCYVTFVATGWLYWTLGIGCFACSLFTSLYILRSKTHFWEATKHKCYGYIKRILRRP
jgi:O-antigen/teichoic acid export membrane protein